MRLSACTTSGQLWQESEMKVSKCSFVSMRLICSITSASTLGGWPPDCSSASTSEVNSWPIGRPAKRMRCASPGRPMEKEGRRASMPSVRTLTLWDSAAMSASSSPIWRAVAESSSVATSSIGCWSFSR